ncbi:Eukaryotic peptide chain release factor GTP-binding subunit ERF3B [Trichinella spiralis]|uniref:Eukaryotic peptide chain release factor GTP-binding subunit ERF3B n=1 Tax=Trichinella spiralis TaxID=6334 RepID=A0ABR3KKP2_TRISP
MADKFQFNPDAPDFIPSFSVVAREANDETANDLEATDELSAEVSMDSNANVLKSLDLSDERIPDEWEVDDEASKEEDVVAPSKSIKKKNTALIPKVRKEYVNVIFIGHVDAGKSTIGGHLMYLTGQVDKRTLEKYEREAKEMNRESWYLSWALDTNIEEREKGKTVQVGRANFETAKKHITILDAPGHKSFVPNMIGGASQADLAVLVISARKGEFEAGLERGGQTREHAVLVKTAGVRHMIVLINKMDDPTVNWDLKRYNECRDKIIPVLKKVGFVPGKDLYFMPCSGQTGALLKDPVSDDVCPWYSGPTFLEYLDQLPPISRAREGAVRVVLFDKYNVSDVLNLKTSS